MRYILFDDFYEITNQLIEICIFLNMIMTNYFVSENCRKTIDDDLFDMLWQSIDGD